MAVADPAPIDEFDAELERALRRRDEIRLMDAEHLVQMLDQRHGRLADADRADRVGFDQGDLRIRGRAKSREQCGGHPPGGAATDDDDALRGGHKASPNNE